MKRGLNKSPPPGYRGLRAVLLTPWALGLLLCLVLMDDLLHPGWRPPMLFIAGVALNVIGIELGFHRLFSHRAFQTVPWMRGVLAVLGLTAGVGSVFSWSIIHRMHHERSDSDGDPHSPKDLGLWYAHVGWLWDYCLDPGDYRRVSDLIDDPFLLRLARVDMHIWVAAGLLLPAAVGRIVEGSWVGAGQFCLWGGVLRMIVAQNLMFSVNSLGHAFGSRPFNTSDQSRDNAFLALPTLGSGWQNTHHAFPSSYSNQLSRSRPDLGAWLIRGLEAFGLAWNLKLPSETEILFKRASGSVKS